MSDVRQAWMGWKASTSVLFWSALLGLVNAATVRHHAARELAVVRAERVQDLRDAGFRVFTYNAMIDEWAEVLHNHIAPTPASVDWKQTDWTPANLYGHELRCVRA